MLALFLSAFLSLFLFLVFGSLVTRAGRLRAGLAEKLLLGLAGVNTISTIASLFLAVTGYLLLALCICALIVAFFIRDDLWETFQSVKKQLPVLLFALPFVLLCTMIALNAPYIYDSALYHIPSIKWIEAYPAVPGLANLQGRFGFDPNIFTFFAFSSLKGLFGQDVYVVNFLVFSILTGYFITVTYHSFKQKGISAGLAFYVVLFVTMLMLGNDISSPAPDFLSIVIPLFILSRVIEIGEIKEKPALNDFIPVIILSAYILTTKLATVPLLLLPVLLFVRYKPGGRQIFLIVASCAIIVIPWLARNVILTGWLVYPFPSVNLFSFNWQVPLAKVIAEKENVTGWARIPGPMFAKAAHMGFLQWVPIWWRELFLSDKLYFLASVGCPLLVFVWQIVSGRKLSFVFNLAVATALAGLIFWFVLAPDFRFGQAFITVAAMSPLLLFNVYIKLRVNPAISFMPLMAALLIIQYNGAEYFIQHAEKRMSRLLIKPELLSVPANVKFITYPINGIIIYAPKPGERCFCHAIPCASRIDTTIRLRGHSLAEGFLPGK